MNRVNEGALAWALADSAAACLKPAERGWVYAKIAAGEQDRAIRDLLGFYANTDTVLPCELAAPILAWIQGYSGTNCEAILRRIYDRISFSDNASRQPPKTAADRSPSRLIAKRSARAARARTTTRRSIRAIERVGTSGITTNVDDAVAAAVEARRVAQTAVEVAVREARSMDWSWNHISAALGGKPAGEELRREFGESD